MEGAFPPSQSAAGHHIAQASHGGVAVVNHYEYIAPQAVDSAQLAAAQQRLKLLPQDKVPAPGVLPFGSRMPLRPNPLFVGRETVLSQVARALASKRRAVVSGLRGVGKTQLASEFVHRYSSYFAGGVFWLSFADANVVASEVAACGGAGHLNLRPDFAALQLEERVRAVLSAWTSELPRLLVFDNCEDAALFDRWAPTHGGAHVLLTSWRMTWPAGLALDRVLLEVLTASHSVALLGSYLQPEAAAAPELATIAAELGYLPLALHLAGSVLAEYPYSFSPASYLETLRSPGYLSGEWLKSDDPSPTGHVQHVAATFALSYTRLEADNVVDALAIDILARVAHLAPG